jgi:hypothetical protein
MSNIAKRPSAGGFLAAIFLHWRTGVLGALSIPLTWASLYVGSHWQRVLTAALALACLTFAPYQAWCKERELLVEAESKCADLEEDKLLNRSPRLRISIPPHQGTLVRNGIEIDCWNDGTVAAYHVTLAPLLLHWKIHFEHIDCIPPGEMRVFRGKGLQKRNLYVYMMEPRNGKIGEEKGWFFPNLHIKPDLTAARWKIPIKLSYGDGSGKYFLTESTLHYDIGKLQFYVQQANISFTKPPV